jgi:hypothetical protein
MVLNDTKIRPIETSFLSFCSVKHNFETNGGSKNLSISYGADKVVVKGKIEGK